MPAPSTARPAASDYSRFVQRIRRRYANQLAILPVGAPVRAVMQVAYDALQAQGLDTGAALRVLRQLVLERLVVLDCDMAPTLVASRAFGVALPLSTEHGAELAWGGPAPLDAEALRLEIRASIAAAIAAGAQLFINDHWQLAIDEGAYGVHLGQEDLHLADLAAMKKAGLRLGISSHAYWEVCRAWALQPSYIACGPIHPTQAKAMPWIAQGNDNLAYWCTLLPTPVVAIAGMNLVRTEQAAQCGVAGVAVISAITAADFPEEAIRQLQEAIQRGKSGQRATAPVLPKPTLLPTL